MWVSRKAFAIAIYPYSSSENEHLKLITGDRVEILEECQEWVRARCISNSCVGICPKNRLEIVSYFNQYVSRNALILEARSLINVLFSKYFIRSNHPSNSDHLLFENIFSLLPCLEKHSISSQIQSDISKIIEEIRRILELPKNLRSPDFSIMTFHSLNSNYLGKLKNNRRGNCHSLNFGQDDEIENNLKDNSIDGLTSLSNLISSQNISQNVIKEVPLDQISSLYVQNNSIIPYQIKYQPMLDITINYIVPLPFDIKVIVRLIDLSNQTIVSESHCSFFPQGSSFVATIIFDNILFSILPRLSAHFVVLSSSKIETEHPEETWCYKYI